MSLEPGSYVTHAKLPQLGSGEIILAEKGTVRIRFASGDRSFLIDAVAPHLVVTLEAPQPPAAKPKRKAATKAKKTKEAKEPKESKPADD